MASKPYTIFDITIERTEALLELHKKGTTLDENDDLLRAAVVFCVAGFDRYFTAKFSDVLVKHLKSGKPIGKDLYRRIEKAGFDTEFSLRLISEAVETRTSRPFRKIRTIVQSSLSSHTTHREDVIDELFKSLGLKDLSQDAAKKTKKTSIPKNVKRLVDLRNEIAHEAHVKQNGQPKAIDHAQITGWVQDVKLFVKACDEIIDSKYGVSPAKSA